VKHTRIVTRVQGGHLNPLVRRQLTGLLAKVKDGTDIVLELFEVPTRRTAAQNDGFHAMITPWARDEGHNVDELKRDLLGVIFGWVGSPLGDTRVPLKPSTSGLTVTEFSELITRSADIAASHGYILQLPSEYKEAKWLPDELRP
jgi:hypothetical protein